MAYNALKDFLLGDILILSFEKAFIPTKYNKCHLDRFFTLYKYLK